MAFGSSFGKPPAASPAAVAPPAPSPRKQTLAQMSAMGTTAGAPALQVSKGTPPGSGLPGSGPPIQPPGDAAQPPANPTPQASDAGPPAGGPTPARPVVAPHAGRSVGTHASRSPLKRGNPAHFGS